MASTIAQHYPIEERETEKTAINYIVEGYKKYSHRMLAYTLFYFVTLIGHVISNGIIFTVSHLELFL